VRRLLAAFRNGHVAAAAFATMRRTHVRAQDSDHQEHTMGKKKAIWTGPHPDGGWQNKVEGGQRASNRHGTKADAQAEGRRMAMDRKTEHVIQRGDGTIQGRNSYGNDPHPPTG
jgi:uncharacterized protein DUF2188